MTKPSSMDCNDKSPATKKIEPQHPFHSQRKRSRQATIRMAKPSNTRKISIQQSLFADSPMTSEEEQRLGKC